MSTSLPGVPENVFVSIAAHPIIKNFGRLFSSAENSLLKSIT